MIRVFSSYYPERGGKRAAELFQCMERNLHLPEISALCLLLEQGAPPAPENPKLKTQSVSIRPSYDDFFRWANALVETPSDVSIIANSDIYFDDSILALAKSLKLNQCAALSRWDVQADQSLRLFDRNDSQDAWVFRGKIRPMNADFCVGIPRCDNRILYELRAAGYEVINPAFSVRACHLHIGERTEYPGQINGPHVEGPYEYLWPHNLMSLPATLLHNIKNPNTKLGWRFDWRRLRRTLPWRVFNKIKRLGATG